MAGNLGKAAGESWNASFGKILKKFARAHPSKIREVEANTGRNIDGGEASASLWEAY